jgi:hypothetical protein
MSTSQIVTALAIAAVAAPLSASAVTAVHTDSPPFAVAIRLSVDSSIASARVAPQLKNEAAEIWRPYGVQLAWTNADVSELAPGSVSLDVSVDRQFEKSRRLDGPRVLGHALMNPAAAWQPIHVSFEATESVLAQRTTGPRSIAGIVPDQDLARALGRVLAHEIGHVLLGAAGHDRAGLMRATFIPDELAEPDSRPFRLTCSSAARLRSRLDALTGYAQRGAEHGSGPLDSADVRETPEFRDQASCIAVQPGR